ncbi:hypothetical protein MJA45_21625 [Paenibacillus aurantius]|uniref:Uncharacterized protein n=1 Tax=Paenibacillus aurantius TaxID=2918900 RepID=A0AA96RGM3_9BACL|nr:hypothetical protein [Paenibacillus aurantius]WNQ10199.1 hypothetical protein MJA45_21625 [Paenibacillus aurantius]
MFKSKISRSLVTAVALFSIFQTTCLADSPFDQKKSKIVNVSDVSITLLSDGRIKGLDKPEKLSKTQKAEILKVIRFTEDDVAQIPDELQNQLLKEGGVKVETTASDLIHTYTDLNGQDHIVTDNNQEEIDAIKANDMKTLAAQSGEITTFETGLGSVQEGSFSARGYVTYLGKSSNGIEYNYSYKTMFTWSARPAWYFEDKIAQTWQGNTTSTNTIGEYKVNTFSSSGNPTGTYYYGLKDVDRSSVSGTTATVDIVYLDGQHVGWLQDNVKIPVGGNEGTTGQFASAYAHSWTNNLIDIILQNLGFQFESAPGDKWTWRNSYIIGQWY